MTMNERLRGQLDYYLRPGLRNGAELFSNEWRGTGPMNGQPTRQVAITQLLRQVNPSMIVETGTYRGITTEFLAMFGVPVHTIEVNPRLHGYASARLRRYKNVTCHLGRSVEVIECLKAEPAAFFYLDAHWDGDVPVEAELREIFTRWAQPIILIDDFQVPGQSYQWLDRGPGKELVPGILGPYEDLSRWYPSRPAYLEAGMNTGWTLIAPGYESILDGIAEVQRV